VNKNEGQYPTRIPDPNSSHQFPCFGSCTQKIKHCTKPSMPPFVANYSKIDIIMNSTMLARLVSETGQKEGKERS